jgi:peptidoglycan hydrolase CwlO-like protein
MCSGSKSPKIVYQGPSQEDIDANQASLDSWQQAITDQQAQFQAQLQQQIDQANQDTADLEERYANEAAAAAAAAAAQQATTYATTVQESETPQNAQTTAASPKKKTGAKTLKIARSAAPAAAGAGLNISSGGYA